MKKCLCSLLLVLLVLPQTIFAAETPKKQLAIVIDDFGNGMEGTEEILGLNAPLTVAVMPFLPTTEADAKAAHKKGHEVIVHLPLEPKKGKRSWLGPGAITADLNDQEIRKRVEAAIDNVPHAAGMNHHMGSKITEDERIMSIILKVCQERGLYYLDSRTTGESVIPAVAARLSLPYLENNMFFDHVYSAAYIEKQASRLLKKLDEETETIAIGHVGVTGDDMARTLKSYIPIYKKKADIVPLSALVPGTGLLDGRMP